MKNENGFTLIEMIVSLILLGFIGLLVGLFFVTGVQSYVTAQQNNIHIQKTNLALTRLSREMKYLNRIEAITTNSIQYDRDSQPFSINRVGGLIRMNNAYTYPTQNTGFTLMDGATNFILSFFRSDGSAWTVPADRSINALYRIQIRIDITVNNAPRTFITQVNPVYNNTFNGPR